jgi:hypothetical protein
LCSHIAGWRRMRGTTRAYYPATSVVHSYSSVINRREQLRKTRDDVLMKQGVVIFSIF